MRDPDKLKIYAAAEGLALAAYRATSSFPAAERFGLTAQIRRAAVSIGSNIAEGRHRQGSRALAPFLHQSLGSTGEMQFQIRLAVRLGFGNEAELKSLLARTIACKKMIARLIVRLRADKT
jgi:four helix bundle protein